jgi:hypothetical protein
MTIHVRSNLMFFSDQWPGFLSELCSVIHPILSACHLPDVHSIYIPLKVSLLEPRKEMRLAEHVLLVAEKRNTHRILARRHKRKGPFERPNHKWKNNIAMV